MPVRADASADRVRTLHDGRTVLTIAGSDSGGGAGIQADLKTFAALGAYGLSALTAVTAQDTRGVIQAVALSADLVTAQIEAVAGDMDIHAVKTGMLATAAVVEAVAAAIAALELPAVVVDPVMVATSGRRLLDEDGVRTLRIELLPHAMVVTPNIPEAEVLSGRTISSPEGARESARAIRGLGPSAVIVTGGHGMGDEVVDLLFDGTDFIELRTPRIRGRHTHGTGCTFSAAVAVYLARGHGLADAAARAQAYVSGAIRHALPIGHGRSPLDHFWNIRPPT